MPDYGHALEFGAFITPVNAPAERPADLALLSEDLGLDLVTFQDHPYQPGFHDTWTLMTWVAAKTERIRVSANVHNIPLRPPAVLARSAAGLDLLSGGRVDLGLGSGGFADAIASMGGPRRTPGEGIEALGEAIEIIRGIWAADERRPLRVEGKHYRVDGVKRGPAPAHDIPIWIGAYKPRMQRLLARVGDGWLPSLPYLGERGLPEGNAVIDAEAERVGRDPREVRRLLNITPAEADVERMTTLALENGVGTFILAADDPEVIAAFAAITSEVRDRVAEARAARGTATGRVRPAAALAARRAGIDYDAVPASLAADAVEPGDSTFGRVRSNYLRGGNPGLVLRPRDVEQVRDALAFARSQDVPLGVRSGGHGVSGRSTNDGGIVIDLGYLDRIEVLDAASRLVRIEPGARWLEVARALQPHGWALTSGDYGGVGVGGIGTAGGLGWLAREHGLTIDHLRAVDLVTATGELVRASETENPDLFWGMRGAGFEFGIAVAFEFEVDEVGEVGFANLTFVLEDPAAALEAYGRIVESAPRDLTASLVLGPSSPGRPATAMLLAVVDSDDPDTVIERLQPFAELGPLAAQEVRLTSYADVMTNAYHEGPHQGQGEPIARSGSVERITPEFAAAVAVVLRSGAGRFFQLRAAGGAVADIPADATAYAARSAGFSLTVLAADERAIDREWDRLRPWFVGAYVSFETGRDDVARDLVWPPEHLARLRALKAAWDPEGVFRDNLGLS